jgi:hypothetical protein
VTYEDCILQVADLLKSPSQQAEVRFTFRRLNRDISLSDWMRDGARLLVFLSRAKDYGPEQRFNRALVPTRMNFPLSLVNLARPGKYLINTRFEVLKNGAETLKAAREGLRALNDYQLSKKGKRPEMIRVKVPYDSEAHNALYAGSACYLDVPNFMAKKLGQDFADSSPQNSVSYVLAGMPTHQGDTCLLIQGSCGCKTVGIGLTRWAK